MYAVSTFYYIPVVPTYVLGYAHRTVSLLAAAAVSTEESSPRRAAARAASSPAPPRGRGGFGGAHPSQSLQQHAAPRHAAVVPQSHLARARRARHTPHRHD